METSAKNSNKLYNLCAQQQTNKHDKMWLMKFAGLFDMQMLCFMANLALITITHKYRFNIQLQISSLSVGYSLIVHTHANDPSPALLCDLQLKSIYRSIYLFIYVRYPKR